MIDLRLGDCLDVMRGIPDASVDAVITDAPYNVSKSGAKIERGNGTRFQGKDISLDFGKWDKGESQWRDYLPEIIRVLSANGVLCLFHEQLELGVIGTHLRDEYGFQIRHLAVFLKSNPAPQARKVKWQNGSEMFLVATKNKGEGHHFNYQLGQSPSYFKRSVNYEHLHPTAKPLDLMEWITKYWSFEGDTILDPFMGSGTTGVACAKLNRNFIGIEINEAYYNIAQRRIQEAQAQMAMPMVTA